MLKRSTILKNNRRITIILQIKPDLKRTRQQLKLPIYNICHIKQHKEINLEPWKEC